jgi:2-polyprenyl-3-methyl-5-hydroxy-6-metoxy-1,4-benzoquinol methylase
MSFSHHASYSGTHTDREPTQRTESMQAPPVDLAQTLSANRIRALARELLYPIPAELRQHHKHIDAHDLDRVREAIETHFHRGWRARERYSEAFYRHDLAGHLYSRLENNRRFVVPWLNAVRPLKEMRILEIGCGTGASTVALAEQGAHVIAIDIDEPALKVARERCRVHGVSAEIIEANAESLLHYGRVDAVLYYAALEHMKHAERMRSLAEAWAALGRGGLLAIIETPNRLWYFDAHTSRLPFFNWLPDDLAFLYSRFSPKEIFRDSYREATPQSIDHFLRRGRGVSYHEIDLAIAATQSLETVSSLNSYFGWRKKLRTPRLARRYKAFLRQVCPGLHEGWLEPDLDVVLRKR